MYLSETEQPQTVPVTPTATDRYRPLPPPPDTLLFPVPPKCSACSFCGSSCPTRSRTANGPAATGNTPTAPRHPFRQPRPHPKSVSFPSAAAQQTTVAPAKTIRAKDWNKNISEKFARFRFFLIFALRSGERKPGQPTSHAQVVELVDTLVSGTSASDSVQVRVLSWAPTTGPLNSSGPVYFFLMRKRPCAVAAALQPVVAPNTNPSTCMQPIGRTPPAHLPSVASVFSPTGRQRENAFLRCSIPIRHRAIHQLLTCSER